MTIDERHVTTALKAYARGIDVTDADLERLEARVGQRLHGDPHQNGTRRPWEWAVAACAVVALVLAVTALWRTRAQEALPATPTPSTITPADLAGVWMVLADDDAGRWLWHITADGRIAFSSTPREYLRAGVLMEPFSLQGGVLDHPWWGAERCQGIVSLPADGRMALTSFAAPTQCDGAIDGEVTNFVRVSPASPAGTTLVTGQEWIERRPPAEPASMADLAGTWLFGGTGTVFVVVATDSTEGNYLVDRESGGVDRDERGTIVLQADGSVVLSPSGGTTCDTVYSRVVTTHATLEVELPDSSCGRVGGPRDTWIRLN